MTDRNDMSNEDSCLHFEAKLVPDLRTKIKKRLIVAICDLKQPCAAGGYRIYHNKGIIQKELTTFFYVLLLQRNYLSNRPY